MKNKLKAKNFQKLKKKGNRHWSYPVKIGPVKVRVHAKLKYKDTVFTKLFNNKKAAVQLYNALCHKNLPEDTPVEIVTLDDVLFTKRKNDVAFMIDGHFLIFTEHQSTLNENMPFRLLLYVVQEYEKLIGYKIVKGKQVSNPLLYKRELISIPKPEFFVLYNGEDAIKTAAKHCIENGILKEFLLKNETEVVAMLFGVYDEEMEKQVIREEERKKAEARVEARVEARIAKERAKTTIDMALDFGYSNEEILFTLQKKLGVTKQQADEYLRKFYDKTL